MTFEQFKQDFEACEREKKYSNEFMVVLHEVSSAFILRNYYQFPSNYFLGPKKHKLHFAYFGEAATLAIREDVYKSLLSYIPNEEKSQIISFCFSKFWRIKPERIANIMICKPTFIKTLLAQYEDDLIPVNTVIEIGKRSYSAYDKHLEIKSIPTVCLEALTESKENQSITNQQ